MITIAMVAVLTSLALPSFTSTIRGNRVTTATNDLLAAINQARGEAVTRARPVTVCASNSANTDCSDDAATWVNGWLIVCSSDAGVQEGCVSADSDDSGVLRVFSGVAPVSVTTTAAAITFMRQGGIAAEATLTLEPADCSNKQKREINVSIMGRARSVERSCSS